MLGSWLTFVTDLLMTHKTNTYYVECTCCLTSSPTVFKNYCFWQEYGNQTTNKWRCDVFYQNLCLLNGCQESYPMMILNRNGMANTMSRLNLITPKLSFLVLLLKEITWDGKHTFNTLLSYHQFSCTLVSACILYSKLKKTYRRCTK